jgi:transglutaminase-like putative cysteine protease
MPTAAPSTSAGRADSAGRVVSCDLVFDVAEPALVTLQVAVAVAGRDDQSSGGRVPRDERLDVASDGRPLSAAPTLRELAAPHGSRLHVVEAPPGALSVSYRADVRRPSRGGGIGGSGSSSTGSSSTGSSSTGSSSRRGANNAPLGLDQLTYLRPSRYCPSDHLAGFATAEFGTAAAGRDTVDAVTAWIYHRIAYVSGSSGVHDDAEHTLLTGQGVCRDFAHLGVALCRAMDVPARFVAVYAPGLTPMDFHAVFEAWIDGGWRVYDATRLVPRQGLVRIATGRDAADTAFASVLGGTATLRTIEVTATVSGDLLPVDDHAGDVELL